MGFLQSVLVLLALFTGLILPWINTVRLYILDRELARQRETAPIGTQESKSAPPPPPPEVPPAPESEPEPAPQPEPTPGPEPEPAPAREEAHPSRLWWQLQPAWLERFPAWLAGIALALAGVFLVQYMRENDLLGPQARVALGVLLGTVLILGGERIDRRSPNARPDPAAISLAGAGITALYASVLAAVRLYELIGPFSGILALAAVTAAAVLLSLRFGPFAALFGLVGGFAAPMLIGAERISPPLLFAYLYIIFAGFIGVIRYHKAWTLAVPTIIGALVWIWTAGRGGTESFDTIWPGIFALEICLGAAILAREADKTPSSADRLNLDPTTIANYLGVGGSILLLADLTRVAGFGIVEWSFFSLLTAAAAVLAFLDDRRHGFLPWLSAAVTAALLATWTPGNPLSLLAGLVSFAAFHIAVGYALMWRGSRPLPGAALAATAAVGYFLLAYFRLRDILVDLPRLGWGLAALALAALAVQALHAVRERCRTHPAYNALQAAFATAATALVSIGLAIVLDPEFLTIAIAAQSLALAWIASRLSVTGLRELCMALGVIFGILLAWEIASAIYQFSLNNLDDELPLRAFQRAPLAQLGLPAAFLAAGAYFLLRDRDGRLVRAFERSAIGVAVLAGYVLIHNVTSARPGDLLGGANMIERAAQTNAMFAAGLACCWAGQRIGRKAVIHSGIVLVWLAMLGTVLVDMLLRSPLGSHLEIVGVPLFNVLLPVYAAPVFWSWLFLRWRQDQAQREETPRRDAMIPLFASLSAFAYVSLSVRHAFQGAYLDVSTLTELEVYTYSAAWLLLGIVLMVAGGLTRNRTVQIASLWMMTLAIIKVFLIDASVLTGLLRVFSMLGLGICLLVLNRIYVHFVRAGKTAGNGA